MIAHRRLKASVTYTGSKSAAPEPASWLCKCGEKPLAEYEF